MFKRDYKNRTVIFQDLDVKNPSNANDFVKWMNRVSYLVDEDYEGPANAYANALVDDSKRYNEYNAIVKDMLEQFTYLCGTLKQRCLPVVMPDYQSFLVSYNKIKTYDKNLYAKAIKEEVKKIEESFVYSIRSNINTAYLHGIPLKRPQKDN